MFFEECQSIVVDIFRDLKAILYVPFVFEKLQKNPFYDDPAAVPPSLCNYSLKANDNNTLRTRAVTMPEGSNRGKYEA